MADVIHKVFIQTGKTLVVVIPWQFAKKLGIKDGTYVKINEDGESLSIRKVDSEEIKTNG